MFDNMECRDSVKRAIERAHRFGWGHLEVRSGRVMSRLLYREFRDVDPVRLE
jgi:hypothetical protein